MVAKIKSASPFVSFLATSTNGTQLPDRKRRAGIRVIRGHSTDAFPAEIIQNQLARDAPRSVTVDGEENSQGSQDCVQENGDGFSAIVLMVFTAFKKDGGRHDDGARFRRLPG